MKQKNKNTIWIVIASCIIISYFAITFIFGNKNTTIVNKPTPIALENQPRLEDDFYDSVNYEQLKKSNLKEDESMWYYMYTDSSKKIDEEKKQIIKNILNNCDSNSNFKKICEYYDSYNKTNNNDVKKELQKYIDEVNKVTNIEEYVNKIIELNKELSLDILVNPKVSFSYFGDATPRFSLDYLSYDFDLNNLMNGLFIYNSDIYNDEENKVFINYFKKYDTSNLKAMGYSEKEANTIVSNVQNIYLDLSKYSLSSLNYSTGKGYKVYDESELEKELNNINLKKILNVYADIYSKNGKILVTDISQLKAVDSYLTEDNLQILKDYAISKIANKYSIYISYDSYKEYLKLYDYIAMMLLGEISELEKDFKKEDFIYASIYNNFMDTIVTEFAKKYYSDQAKEFYTNLIEEEMKTFEKNILGEDWLSFETKQKAVEKLNNIKHIAGLPDKMIYVEKNYNIGENYVVNLISINKEKNKESNKQLLKGNKMFGTDYLDLNAYYMPSDNSINILLGEIFAVEQLFGINDDNRNDNYYAILGSLGHTIGHELTHGFDSSGSNYDKNGNYANWWTKEDRKEFDILCSKVVKYYYNYKMLGDNTLAENIADLGGMRLIMTIAKDRNATKENYKTMFESYANEWGSQATSYMSYVLLYGDTHSANKVRVNAILSSTNEFYETYNIKENDKMFVSEQNRVKVW